jgi:pseudo-rSAM protein
VSIKLDLVEISKDRMKMNPSNFGKLIVNTNGDCYANINAAKLGNIYRDTLYEIIYKETRMGKSWRRVRSRVEPCKRCLYALLCPPLSNYEYVINRNNLCKVFQEEKSTIRFS